MTWVRRCEPTAIVLVAVAVTALPIAWRGWPNSLQGNVITVMLTATGLSFVWWRSHPRRVAAVAAGLLGTVVVVAPVGAVPDASSVLFPCLALLLAISWTGREAVVAAVGGLVWLVAVQVATGTSPVALLVLTVPAYLAGTAYRLQQQMMRQLAQCGRDLERERELVAAAALDHERSRVASELHDIVGHAVSVMVVQAAAGQRLVGRDPDAVRACLSAIRESAAQGQAELVRLVDLLAGVPAVGSDLILIEGLIAAAERSGLVVSFRFDGDRAAIPAPTAHVAFRVVQEGLTNILRYAPDAAARVRIEGSGQRLIVRVDNDAGADGPPTVSPTAPGSGQGLPGLRRRVVELGGCFQAGPTLAGGWSVRAEIAQPLALSTR